MKDYYSRMINLPKCTLALGGTYGVEEVRKRVWLWEIHIGEIWSRGGEEEGRGSLAGE